MLIVTGISNNNGIIKYGETLAMAADSCVCMVAPLSFADTAVRHDVTLHGTA